MDKYKLCLDRLSESVCTVIQGNSAFRKMDQKMELAPPPKQDPYELVASSLSSDPFEEYKDKKTQIGLYEKQAVEHREARRALHSIRTFIQHDYWIIGIQRTELDNLRAEMDFAKSELKSAKDPQLVDLKNKVYNQAVHAFEGKLNEVTKLMDAVARCFVEADFGRWVSRRTVFTNLFKPITKRQNQHAKKTTLRLLYNK
ncbi:unnamed protein product [Heligmosomoides polygyrus]|uniref:BAR domain-containing protein n=1 Tax=Heligmosomoides polygyrus TaxID=6339 RepID=A0A3P7UC54_HELPZ|nr:unnamed protein product [Heligmosomoides polygyrus]